MRRATARLAPDQLRLAMAAPAPAAGFTSRHVPLAGTRLHVRGRSRPDVAGPHWVLLHGLAVSHRYLMPTAAALTDRSVHVPDLPGFGLSEKPPHVYDTVEHAETVAGWLDAVAIPGAYLLANSFGCQVAVELAARRPDLVSALVLVGPTVDPAAPTSIAQVRRWLRDVLREDPRQARILAADVRDAGLRRVVRTLRHSTRHLIEQRIPLVEAPMLLLRGEHDPIAPAAWLARASRLHDRCSTAVIPRAAHNAVTTAGEDVAAHATAFVAGLAG